MEDVLVTVDHLYSVPNFSGRAGFCGRGARAFFTHHRLDWSVFVRDGLPASAFLATGDAMAARLVAHARTLTHG